MLNNIKYDETFKNEDYQTLTHYFIVPKETFNVDDEDVIHLEISVEVPINNQTARYADIMWAKTIEVDGGTEDIDWTDIHLPYDEVEDLLKIANEEYRGN